MVGESNVLGTLTPKH